MAVPANTATTLGSVGFREDLSDKINMIAPMETPLFSKSPKVKATARKHEWLTDDLRSSAVNAHLEGDDTANTGRTERVRLYNNTQIFKETTAVADGADSGDYAGSKKLMAAELYKDAKALKKDVEKALFANQARVDESGSTAARLAGLPAWIVTNEVVATAGSPVSPAGDGSTARTPGTSVVYAEANLTDNLKGAWNAGGKPDTLYIPPDLLEKAASFTGNSQRREMQDEGKRGSMIDVYMTNFGQVQFVPSREMLATDVFAIQSDMVRVATKRAYSVKDLAKTGDSTRKQHLIELTLEVGNEAACAVSAARKAA